MTEQQRQLILEYARTEQLVNGTVNGLEQGLLYCLLASFPGSKVGIGLVPPSLPPYFSLFVFSECDIVCQRIIPCLAGEYLPLSQVVRKTEGREEEEEEKKASWYKRTKASSSD